MKHPQPPPSARTFEATSENLASPGKSIASRFRIFPALNSRCWRRLGLMLLVSLWPLQAYAQSYTVTYHGNGSNAGSVPIDGASHVANGTATVLAPGNLTRSAHVFSHWDATATDSGADFDPGDTLTVTGNVTLYAQWTPVKVDPATPTGAAPVSGGTGWTMVFSDEFNGSSLDTSKWGVDVSTTSRAARPSQGINKWYWKPENVSLDGAGNLVLDVTKVSSDTMHCGSVSSDGLFQPRYGYLEARIKIANTTKSTHTAFWMQGPNMNNSDPADGTAYDGAEIDIFESAWFGDYTKAVVHIDGYDADHRANTKQYTTTGLHSGYHVFGLEWTETSLKIYYDGVLKTSYTGIWVPQVTEWLWLSCGASFGDVGTFASEPIGWLTSANVDYVRVWKSAVNIPPMFAADPIAAAAAWEETPYSGTIAGSATDANGDPLTYAKVAGPAWLSVATNGTLSGTPANSDVGTNVFTVSVSDGIAAPIQATLNITVTNTNDAPVWTSNPIVGANAAEDSAYSGSLAGNASDDDAGTTLTYAKVGGPAWLTVAANGTLSGTPANGDVGANSFTVSVSDGVAAPVNATLDIAVININDAPVWVNNPLSGGSATEDAAYSGSLAGSASDADAGATLAFAKVSGPAWLTVESNGALSGTPGNSNVGVNSFTVSASDGIAAPVTTTLNITVINTNDAPVFIVNPIITANANEGVAYSGQTLAGKATDADAGDTITYSKVSGPAWLAVASDGTLSGTPGSGTAGLNSFIVRAIDSTSATADATLEITVTGLPLPWVSADIGTGMLAGSATHNAGTFTQAGSGIIGSTSDKLRFTYQTLTGDGEIIARISSLQNTGTSSRVGVMIRDSLAANSKQILMGMTGNNQYRWDRRTTTGGSTTSSKSSTGTVPNTWVRLVRSGTTITAYKSTNGTSWTSVGSTTNTTFASTCYIGLAVGSGSDATLNTSQFGNLSVTP